MLKEPTTISLGELHAMTFEPRGTKRPPDVLRDAAGQDRRKGCDRGGER
jgi:hypothetical protein